MIDMLIEGTACGEVTISAEVDDAIMLVEDTWLEEEGTALR